MGSLVDTAGDNQSPNVIISNYLYGYTNGLAGIMAADGKTFIHLPIYVAPCLSDLGSITLKCNALHYNYFQNHCITLQLQLQGF